MNVHEFAELLLSNVDGERIDIDLQPDWYRWLDMFIAAGIVAEGDGLFLLNGLNSVFRLKAVATGRPLVKDNPVDITYWIGGTKIDRKMLYKDALKDSVLKALRHEKQPDMLDEKLLDDDLPPSILVKNFDELTGNLFLSGFSDIISGATTYVYIPKGNFSLPLEDRTDRLKYRANSFARIHYRIELFNKGFY